tara:strand:+ start:57 stop:260 length:204 start_codon:yes stop_codon:yes gene_type:complete
MTIEQSKAALLAYLTKGVQPNFSSIGGYTIGSAAIDELLAEGRIARGKVPSKSGKTLQSRLVIAKGA